MARAHQALYRVRSAESSSRSYEEEAVCSAFDRKSDDRSRAQASPRLVSLPHCLRLWMKQLNLIDLVPPKASESGGAKDLGDMGGSRRGPALSLLKCIVLCCVSLLLLVAALGSTSWTMPSSSSSPSSIYRGYRRLREQVMADFSDIGVLSLGITHAKELSLCSRDVEDFIPCYNVTQNQILGYGDGEEFDRHCYGASRSSPPCLVRPPKDYKIPLRWPTGRDVIWSGNVKITKEQLLSSGSLTKRLMLLEDNQISFRSEDALVVDGVEDYSHQIAEMIGLRNESEFIQAGVHTVLDIGCGFGSFGAHLFSKQLLTICIASYEVYGSQVQLALERGLPAMLGSFVSKQLPYPSLSFDMIHCARCGIEWEQKDGAFLIEADRVLKPGGYFVWTSPLTNLHGPMLKTESQRKWEFILGFTEKLCWILLSQQEETVVWQKTSNRDCYTSRKLGGAPPVCSKGQDAESPYYQPLLTCIGGTLSRRWMPIQNQSSWPNRMTPSSKLLATYGIQPEEFVQDSHTWISGLKNYWSLLTPLIFSDHPKRPGEEDPLPPFNMIRNVMDMNARYGGLNALIMGSSSFNQLLYFLGLGSNLKAMDIALALLGYMLFLFFVQRKRKGLPMWPLLGMLPSLVLHLNEIHDWVTQILKDCGGTFVFKGPTMSPMITAVTANPANLEHVLKLRFNDYRKGGYFRAVGHDFLGDGIFNADADVWKMQRKTANIQFNTPSFRALMAGSVEELVQTRLVPLLRERAESGDPVELQDVLLRFTFDNVCMVTLGVNPGCLVGGGAEASDFARAFEDATEIMMLRFLMPPAVWRFMRFLDLGPEQKLRRSLTTVNKFLDKAIRSRIGNNSSCSERAGADLLSAFMEVKTEHGDRLYTDKKLQEIVVNFILAGRDTSSVALSWFFWLLLRYPRVEEHILAEIQSVLSKRSSTTLNQTIQGSNSPLNTGNLNFTVEELKQMHYLQAALSESLRLFPSVPFDFKNAYSDDWLPDGTFIKKGTKLIYSIYSMGRMENIWGKDCMEFRPERWLDKGGSFVSESAYKYPVFNGGPRLCLGKDFAYYQMKWIAATIIWGFKMKMVEGHVVEPKLALTLYMKNGLLVTLQERDHPLRL